MTSEPENQDESRFWSRFAAGVGLAIGSNLAVGLVIAIGTGIGFYALQSIPSSTPYSPDTEVFLWFVPVTWFVTLGFSQVVHLLPLGGFLWMKGQRPAVMGVITGAALTFLLTGALNAAVVGSTTGGCAVIALGSI